LFTRTATIIGSRNQPRVTARFRSALIPGKYALSDGVLAASNTRHPSAEV